MLTTRRPTQTTALYTVSNRATATTLSAQLKVNLHILLRIIAGLLILCIVGVEYMTLITPSSPWHSKTLNTLIHATPVLARTAGTLTTLLSWYYRWIIITGTTYLITTNPIRTESLLVIRGLGVQTSTSSPSYLWTSSARFIPTTAIQDILIHEAFKGFEVRFYLAIVVEGEEEVVVVFPNLLPRRDVLEEVWRGTRACLYEPKT
ncbi:hypothetical protein LTR78_006890 [Recurvomyces mirabilis]|uniref:Phosphatidylinositol N-acetylglucosaminyltransferase subunit H conserved domain-containing protein n=1 Tax=Recurvomyces mirabilis TaxID=574656 RepID=A0AAE1BZL6_9PEZI|nr:hypothetical protein LTR78_006890 [Recurvomyces mirabilis]KAK5153119.1 hypothetical protein LTS14_007763 [Recurvomyces mirabilis]